LRKSFASFAVKEFDLAFPGQRQNLEPQSSQRIPQRAQRSPEEISTRSGAAALLRTFRDDLAQETLDAGSEVVQSNFFIGRMHHAVYFITIPSDWP
jgi:hypothetical protein